MEGHLSWVLLSLELTGAGCYTARLSAEVPHNSRTRRGLAGMRMARDATIVLQNLECISQQPAPLGVGAGQAPYVWPVLVWIYMNKPHVKAAFEEGRAYSQ